MRGEDYPTRRRLLRLSLGGLLASAGCDTAGWLGPEDRSDTTTSPNQRPAPSTEELRARSIREAAAALTGECAREAGGDWTRWVANLEGFRADLRAKIEAARPARPAAPDAGGAYEARSPVLEARGAVPLFECAPAGYLRYLVEPGALDDFRRRRPVAAVSHWLRTRGIDLLFVPVPKMTEVYAARIAGPCPRSGIVAPQVRRVLLELLQHDAEVVDLLPAFLAAEDRDARPLYFPDDPHWGPRGWEVAARVVCDRLRRYPWARAAQEAPSLFTTVETPYRAHGVGYPALTADQRRRVDRTRRRSLPLVKRAMGEGGVFSPDAPVLVIGDSYAAGFSALLARGLNQPVAVHSSGGQTTQGIKEAVRNPELLKGRAVVVWVVCHTNLVNGKWDLPPAVTTTE